MVVSAMVMSLRSWVVWLTTFRTQQQACGYTRRGGQRAGATVPGGTGPTVWHAAARHAPAGYRADAGPLGCGSTSPHRNGPFCAATARYGLRRGVGRCPRGCVPVTAGRHMPRGMGHRTGWWWAVLVGDLTVRLGRTQRSREGPAGPTVLVTSLSPSDAARSAVTTDRRRRNPSSVGCPGRPTRTYGRCQQRLRSGASPSGGDN